MATPTAEQTFDTDVMTGAGYTFTAATPTITETTAGPTASASQVIDSDVAGATLTGDGSSPALNITGGATVNIENVSIANTGVAAAVAIGTGATAIFGDGDGGALDTMVANLGNVSAPITGSGNVEIDGAFNNELAVKFSGANSYTGTTTISGMLEFGANGSINDSKGVTLSGTLDASGAESSTGAVTTLTLNTLTDTGTIDLGANSLIVTGVSTISGAVNSTGLAGVQFGAVGGTLAANTTTVSDALDYAGSTKIYGDLVLDGGSVVDSSNVSLKASGATLDVTAAATSEVDGNVMINELTGVAGSIITLGANTLEVTERSVAASFSGVINGTGGLTVDGPTDANPAVSELTLAGKNTYTGATIIEDGATVGLAGAGTLGAAPTAMTTGSALTLEGTLDISQLTTGSFTLGAFTDDGSTGSVALGANRLIVESAAAADSLATVTGVGGSLQVGTAAGATAAMGMTAATPDATVLTLTGTSTYTGSTVVYGDLVVDGSISASSNVSLKVAGATVDFSDATNNGTFFTTSDISSTGTTQGGVLINELTGVAGTNVIIGNEIGSTLIINETTNASFSGVISDGGEGYGIVVRGPATLTLDGANTYSGETLIKGHLDLGAGGSIVDSGVYDNGVFDVTNATGPVAIDGLSGDNADATVILGSNTLVINGEDGDDFDGQHFSFAGIISGNGGVTINDELGLTNANTYMGATTVAVDGELDLYQGGSIASTSIVNNGEIYVFESGITLGTVISGSGGLTVGGSYEVGVGPQGAGSVTITAADTYTGETDIYHATLAFGSGGSIENSLIVLNDDTSALDLSAAGGPVTIAALYSNDGGTVTLGTNNLILSGVATPGTQYFDGVISGSGSVQINSGTGLDVQESQQYTGSTIVYGVLDLEGASRLDSSNVSLKSANGVGGVFDISGATTIGAEPTVMVRELTGQFGSHVYLGGNTLEVTETTAASFSGVISDGTTLDANTNVTSGDVGGLTVDGSVYLTLTNTETYTGVTTINGDLALGAATGASTIGSIAASSGLVDDGFFAISGSATVNDLSGTGVVKIGPAPDVLTINETAAAGTTFSGIIHGAGILNVTGAAAGDMLTLTGAGSDYSGGTHLTSGTLELAALGAAGSGAITFENSAATLALTNAALTGGNTATESFGNTLDIANHGGTVDLMDLTFETSNPNQTFTVAANGSLTITEGNVHVTLMTDLTSGTMVTAAADAGHGTAFHFATAP